MEFGTHFRPELALMEFKNFGDVINLTSGIFVTFKDFFGLFAPSLDTVIKLEKFCILVFIKSLLLYKKVGIIRKAF